jgi:aminoglycoside phosphotransferase (APT) family kinase protein
MSSEQFDTIEVRPDEQLNQVNLAAYLRDKLDGAIQALSIRQFGGGAANLTYLLSFGSHQYVLRRPPIGPIAPSAHDMAREYRVLSTLYHVFPYAPNAYLLCDDLNVIGAPFIVMERRQGVVVRRSLPDVYATVSDAPQRMSLALVDALADLHAINYTALGLGSLGKPDGFIDRQIEGWYGRWNKAKVDDVLEMDRVYEWLKKHVPSSSIPTLVHNDYKLDNVMLAREDPNKLVAIFDWDMCTLGDPLADLGTLLTYWTEPSDPPYLQLTAMMPIGDHRFPSRNALIKRYAERSGRDVSGIQFYHTLGLYRLVVICAQIYIRYKRGQTQDQRFADFGMMIPLLAKAAWETSQA